MSDRAAYQREYQRRYSRAKTAVLQRLKREQPATYQAWMAEAWDAADESFATSTEDPPPGRRRPSPR